MAIFQRLNQTQGITVIVVTHDSDIAEYSNRSLHFKDGRLRLDEKRSRPRDAARDLEELRPEQEEETVSS